MHQPTVVTEAPEDWNELTSLQNEFIPCKQFAFRECGNQVVSTFKLLKFVKCFDA